MRKPGRAEVLLLTGSIVASFLVAELGLRVYQRVTNGVPLLSVMPRGGVAAFPRSPLLVFGPRVNVSFQRNGRPEWSQFNEMGIRLPGPVPPKEPGEVRVLALGGSTTEGLAADLRTNTTGIHWPLGFECLLHARGRNDVRVLNAGMSAYTTAHSFVQYAFDLVELRPDFVLIMHNINDLMVTYRAASLGKTVDPTYLVRYGRKRFTGRVEDSDLVFSRLWHSISVRLQRPRPDQGDVPWERWEYDLSTGEHYFRRNLRELVRSIRQSGAVPVLLTMARSSSPEFIAEARAVTGVDAALTLFPAPERFYADFDRFNDVVREVAAAERIPLVDMARVMPSDKPMYLDTVHHSEEGVRTFARLLDSLSSTFLPHATGATLKPEHFVSCAGVF